MSNDHQEKAKAIVEKLVEQYGDHGWIRSVDVERCLVAALAEQYQTGWNEGSQAGHDARYPALEAELAQLRAKLAENQQYYEADYKMLKAERDAAYRQGIEDYIHHSVAINDAWVRYNGAASFYEFAMAEIDKAKK